MVTASITNKQEVKGSHSIIIKTDKLFTEVESSSFDMVEGADISETGRGVDDKIITGRGAGFAMAFSLKLVEILIGEEMAINLGRKMLVEKFL